MFVAGVPSEPGGVGARTIPFGAGQGAEEMAERFAVVAENGARRGLGAAAGGQSMPGLAEARVAGLASVSEAILEPT